MVRSVLLTLMVLAGLALTAALLAWPGRSEVWSAGGVSVSGGMTAIYTKYRYYGLLDYLAVREELGFSQSGGKYLDLDPQQTFLTGLLVVSIWAAIWVAVGFMHRLRTTKPGAVADRGPPS